MQHKRRAGVKWTSSKPMADLVFNIIDWHFEDYCDGEDETPTYLMKIFGKTKEGVTVALECTDYTPHFYIKAPTELNAMQVKSMELFLAKRFRDSFMGAKGFSKKDFWGFHHNQTYQYIQLLFKNESAMKRASYLFGKPVQAEGVSTRPIKYTVVESNIPPFLRFCHKKEIRPSGWVRVQAGKYQSRSLLQSTAQIDATAKWSNVDGVEVDAIAPFKIASFDIECVPSFDDEFPTAVRDIKKVAQRYASDDTKDAYVFLNRLFKNNSLRPKVPLTDEQLRTLLKSFAGDLTDIKDGTMGYIQGELKPLPCPREPSHPDIVADLANKMQRVIPPLEGDPVIMIGTTVHHYGERAATSKYIHVLGTCDAIEGATVVTYETEKEMLLGWTGFIQTLDPDVFLSWNGFGFDFQYVYDRAEQVGCVDDFCKLGRITNKVCELTTKMLSSSALGDNIMKLIEMDGRVNIDLMKVVQRDHKLDSYKLDNVAHHFTGQKKNDVSPQQIFKLYRGTSADRKVVAEYCIQDCALLNALCVKLEIMANNIGMANVCYVPLNWIFMRGQGIKIFSLVSKQCKEDDFMMPVVRPNNNITPGLGEDGYEGAIVLDPAPGMYLDEPVAVLDYASLYPSSMISENISHDTIITDSKFDNLPGIEYVNVTYDVYEGLGDKKTKVGEKTCRYAQNVKGVLPRILQTLLAQRKVTRKKIEYQTLTLSDGTEVTGLVGKESDGRVPVTNVVSGNVEQVAASSITEARATYDEFQKAVLDGLQLAYKVTANSLYGQVGARTSPIYMKDLAASTTAVGRSMIMKAKKFIEDECQGEVIYGECKQ